MASAGLVPLEPPPVPWTRLASKLTPARRAVARDEPRHAGSEVAPLLRFPGGAGERCAARRRSVDAGGRPWPRSSAELRPRPFRDSVVQSATGRGSCAPGLAGGSAVRLPLRRYEVRPWTPALSPIVGRSAALELGGDSCLLVFGGLLVGPRFAGWPAWAEERCFGCCCLRGARRLSDDNRSPRVIDCHPSWLSRRPRSGRL
jgi:hypothetical protein